MLVTSTVSAACAADRTTQPSPPRGISVAAAVYDTDAVLEKELTGIAQVGATWVRVDFDWSVAAPTPHSYNWSYIDRVVAGAASHGLQVLGVLGNAPTWARVPGTSSHGAPTDVEDFAAFAHAAASRHGGAVHTWEIWNEPNTSDFWEPVPQPDRYAELLRRSAAAIHEVQPSAVVLSGGLSPTTDVQDGSRVAPSTFLQRLYANGAMADVDGVAMHPYTFPQDPTAPDTALMRLPEIHELMAANGDGDKPVWVTEFGVPTGTAAEAVSERQQALMLTETYRRLQRWTWVEGIFFYQLRDGGPDRSDLEQNFGLLHTEYSEKPAYGALRRALQ